MVELRRRLFVKKDGRICGVKNTLPNKLIAIVISAVTGSPCLVKISMPEPIMLIPMKVVMPKAKTIIVPKTLTLKITPKKDIPIAR